MNKKLFIGLHIVGFLVLGAIVLAAPVVNFQPSVVPNFDNRYYLGTTTPKLYWSNVYSNSITLTNGTATTTINAGDLVGGATIPNLIYSTIGTTKYYTASSTATDNLSYSFKNGFVTNASTSIQTLNLANALTVNNGGTGQTSFTAGRLLYGSATDGISNTSTSSASCASGVSCSSFTVVGGVAPSITLTSSSITLNTNSPLTGGGSVSLGGSLTFDCVKCLTDLTINTIGTTKYIGASTTALAWSFPSGFTSNASSTLSTATTTGVHSFLSGVYNKVSAQSCGTVTCTIDFSTGRLQKVTMTGNPTIVYAGLGSANEGYFELNLCQDGTGSRTITFPSNSVWTLPQSLMTASGYGATTTLDSTANTCSTLVIKFDSGQNRPWIMASTTGIRGQ